MTDAPQFTNGQKAEEAGREVLMRMQVYARQAGGSDKISPGRRRQIAIMGEIEAEYAEKATADLHASGITQEDFLSKEGFTC